MDLGLKISAGIHALLILLAIFGGQIFRERETEPEIVTSVTLISQGELAALVEDPVAQPEPEPEEQPEPEELPDPEPAPETPLIPEGLPDDGVAADEDQAGELVAEVPDPDVKPEAADIVSNKVNEVPDPVPEEASQTVEATEEVEDAQPEQDPQEQTVEEATTTEIVTEAEETAKTGAPVKTSIPRRKPDLAQPVVEPEPLPEPEPEVAEQTEEELTPSLEDLISDVVEETLTETPGNSDQGDPSPVPLTAAEATGLILNIQRCWSLPVGVENAASLKVVVGFDLTREGFVEGIPTLVEPFAATGNIQQAFEAARRAVLQCQPYILPVDKYDTWKKLEIEFNPQNMVNR